MDVVFDKLAKLEPDDAAEYYDPARFQLRRPALEVANPRIDRDNPPASREPHDDVVVVASRDQAAVLVYDEPFWRALGSCLPLRTRRRWSTDGRRERSPRHQYLRRSWPQSPCGHSEPDHQSGIGHPRRTRLRNRLDDRSRDSAHFVLVEIITIKAHQLGDFYDIVIVHSALLSR